MQDKYSENSESIEEFFRKGFESHEERPPDEVWDNIATFLDAKEKSVQAEKTFFQQHWGKMLSGTVLIASFAIWYVLSEKEEAGSVPLSPLKDTAVFASPPKASQKYVQSFDEKKVERVLDKRKKASVPDRKKDSASATKLEEQEVIGSEPEIIPEPQPLMEEVKQVEEEPGNLYDQMKKEQKGMKPLFIEKKK